MVVFEYTARKYNRHDSTYMTFVPELNQDSLNPHNPMMLVIFIW